MKEQKVVLNDVNAFEPVHIFECGQCFRWDINEDKSYTGIIKNGVLNVKKENNNVSITGVVDGDLQEIVTNYFDLNRDYEKIKTELSKIDEPLRNSIKYGEGIRILNQDLWETIISFIISANNNIPRIKGIIKKISEKYGNEIIWNDKKYYTFPTKEQLSKASVQDLRSLGLGFRDVRVYETTKMIVQNKVNLEKLHEEKESDVIREKLLTLSGVGPKVADCILLFSTLKRLDVFPIDVWVRRVMNELYIKNAEESKVSKKVIHDLAREKYGNLAGLAQQYLFYWKREA